MSYVLLSQNAKGQVKSLQIHIKQNFYVTKHYLHIKIIRIESIISRNFVFMNNINEWVSFILIIIISSNNTGASDRSFYPIFNKKFDYLETFLTIHRPKKILSAGSLCGSLVPSPQSKCPKRTFMLPQKDHASVSNMLS